jgi:hypothetical protein
MANAEKSESAIFIREWKFYIKGIAMSKSDLRNLREENSHHPKTEIRIWVVARKLRNINVIQ